MYRTVYNRERATFLYATNRTFREKGQAASRRWRFRQAHALAVTATVAALVASA